MYTVTHQFMTINNDGQVVVHTTVHINLESEDVEEILSSELRHPGGLSGTTISLTVHLTEEVSM